MNNKQTFWLWDNDDFNSQHWFCEILPDCGVFSEEWAEIVFFITRFPNFPNIFCDKCNKRNIHFEVNVKSRREKRIKCKGCRRQKSVTSGTHLNNSIITPARWLRLCYLIGDLKAKMSSHQIARDLGISQKSAYYAVQKIKIVHGIKSKSDGYSFPLSINSQTILEKLLSPINNDSKTRNLVQ